MLYWYSTAIYAVGRLCIKLSCVSKTLSKWLSPCGATDLHFMEHFFVSVAGTGSWGAMVVMSVITNAFSSGAWQTRYLRQALWQTGQGCFPNLLHFTFVDGRWVQVQTTDAGWWELLLHTSYFSASSFQHGAINQAPDIKCYRRHCRVANCLGNA